MRPRKSLVPFLFVGALLASATAGWSADCGPDWLNNTQLAELIHAAADSANGKWTVTRENLAKLIAEAPSVSGDAEQVEAPSRAGDVLSIVDAVDFTKLVALATETDLLSRDEGKYTLSLNAFAFQAAVRPEVVDKQSEYDKYGLLRRLGGSVAFGGKGDSLDTDGDGVREAPSLAQNLDDIIDWDVQVRVVGTRDHRDHVNYDEIENAADLGRQRVDQIEIALLRAVAPYLVANNEGCVSKGSVQSALSRPEIQEQLTLLGRSAADVRAKMKEAVQRIDRRLLVTLTIGGTERKKEFGSDKRSIGLKGSVGGKGGTLTGNLNWVSTPSAGPDPWVGRIGLEYGMLWFRSAFPSRGGLSAALAGMFERTGNVPSVPDQSKLRIGFKLVVPLTSSVNVPFSIAWANRRDLLNDEDEVRAHIGFTFNLGKALEAALEEGGDAKGK